MVHAQLPNAGGQAKASPLEVVLVEPEMVSPTAVAQWKSEGFKAVAVILDERASNAIYREVAQPIAEGKLDLYCWIEVGRNPKLADAHPRWMASLGMHKDWQKNFPKLPEPKDGEVAKAYPWIPIGYQETFDAQLERIGQLLKLAPAGWHGLLLNDLQAGPSSCGCGNLQCRWAIDYRVPSTSTKLAGDQVAARFVGEVRKRAQDKVVIPVWTTECEEIDLPADKNQGRAGTGLCGTVGCAVGTCPTAFTRQWSALVSGQRDPIALLALPAAFQRTDSQFGGGPGWITNAVAYLDKTLPANNGKTVAWDRLWVVIDGSTKEIERVGRRLAAERGLRAVVVARAQIDQSYEPRIISAR